MCHQRRDHERSQSLFPRPPHARHDTARHGCGVRRATRSIQCATCDVESATYIVQRTAYEVQRAACNAQHAICNVKRATCDVRRASCNAQRATCNMQRATCGVRRAACSVQCATCSVQRALPCELPPGGMKPPPSEIPIPNAGPGVAATGQGSSVKPPAAAGLSEPGDSRAKGVVTWPFPSACAGGPPRHEAVPKLQFCKTSLADWVVELAPASSLA